MSSSSSPPPVSASLPLGLSGAAAAEAPSLQSDASSLATALGDWRPLAAGPPSDGGWAADPPRCCSRSTGRVAAAALFTLICRGRLIYESGGTGTARGRRRHERGLGGVVE